MEIPHGNGQTLQGRLSGTHLSPAVNLWAVGQLDPSFFVGNIVHQQILPQTISTGKEYPPFIYTRHLSNESAERATALKHKGIYHYSLLGTVPHFS